MKAKSIRYILQFKRPSGTSRGVLTDKETWFLVIEKNGKKGIGECGILRTLSYDDRPDYKEKLQWVCDHIHLGKERLWEELSEFPSIQFGVETAFLSLESNNPFLLFPSGFTSDKKQIPINGLVWMGEVDFMREQIQEKLQQGFRCVKLKIGAIDFEKELALIHFIRKNFDENTIEIRLDANGGFSEREALDKLKEMSGYKIHSVEQPISVKKYDTMADLCDKSLIDIALDEELIGVIDFHKKEELLKYIKPHYIILKPSLVGGFRGSQQWIDLAAKYCRKGWWVTSALESNIGLNAIAQWTFTLQNKMPQGLGTGGLYTNNFDSPLEVKNGNITYNNSLDWDVQSVFN